MKKINLSNLKIKNIPNGSYNSDLIKFNSNPIFQNNINLKTLEYKNKNLKLFFQKFNVNLSRVVNREKSKILNKNNKTYLKLDFNDKDKLSQNIKQNENIINSKIKEIQYIKTKLKREKNKQEEDNKQMNLGELKDKIKELKIQIKNLNLNNKTNNKNLNYYDNQIKKLKTENDYIEREINIKYEKYGQIKIEFDKLSKKLEELKQNKLTWVSNNSNNEDYYNKLKQNENNKELFKKLNNKKEQLLNYNNILKRLLDRTKTINTINYNKLVKKLIEYKEKDKLQKQILEQQNLKLKEKTNIVKNSNKINSVNINKKKNYSDFDNKTDVRIKIIEKKEKLKTNNELEDSFDFNDSLKSVNNKKKSTSNEENSLIIQQDENIKDNNPDNGKIEDIKDDIKISDINTNFENNKEKNLKIFFQKSKI